MGFSPFRLKRSEFAMLCLRFLTLTTGFLATIAVGHVLGASATGVVGLIVQTSILSSSISTLGLDLAMMRVFAPAIVNGHRIPKVLLMKLLTVVSGMDLAFCLVFILYLRISATTVMPTDYVGIGIFAAFLRPFIRFSANFIQAHGALVRAQLIEFPINVAMLLSVLMPSPTLWMTLQFLFAGFCLAAISALFGILWCGRRSHSGTWPDTAELGEVMRLALPTAVAAICIASAEWVSLVFVAEYFGSAQTGAFRLAAQITTGFTALFFAISLSNLPALARLAANANWTAFDTTLRNLMTTLAVTVAPFAIGMLVFAGPLLTAIHPQFACATGAFRALIVAQTVAIILGPYGVALVMLNKTKENITICFFRLVGILSFGPIAGIYGGIFEIALVVSVGVVLQNIWSWLTVKTVIRSALFQTVSKM